MYKKLFGNLLQCSAFAQRCENRFVFLAGPAPAESPAERMKSEVSKEMQPYFDRIDMAENDPKKLEAVLADALRELANKYSGKIDDTQSAQKTALAMLVDRACDIDGDGKINTPQEQKLKADINGEMTRLMDQIDTAAVDAKKKIDGAGTLAREMTREATQGVGRLEINDLANSNDVGVKQSYERFSAAEKRLADARTKYGLGANTPVNQDTVGDALDALADKGDVTYKRVRRKGQLEAEAAKVTSELKGLEGGVVGTREGLVKAIDGWKNRVVAEAQRAFGGKKVEAEALVKKIDGTKVNLVAESEKELAVKSAKERAHTQDAGEAQKLNDLQSKLKSAKSVEGAAEDHVREKGDILAAAKEKYGMGKNTPINVDNVGDALDALADKGDMTYKRARRQGKLETLAAGVTQTLLALEKDYNDAWNGLKRAKAEVANVEDNIYIREQRLADVSKQGRSALAQAEDSTQIDTARAKLEQKKALAERRAKGPEPVVAKPQPAPAPAPEVANVTNYTIKRGDTMFDIARKFYGSTNAKDDLKLALKLQEDSLGKVDNLSGGKSSLIKPGQEIKLPKTVLGRTRIG